MKRSPLLRKSRLVAKTPLRCTSRLVSKTRLKVSKLLTATCSLKRTAMKRSGPKKRSAEQGGDEAFLRFIRGLPCVVYGTAPPSHAHHEVGGGRGKSQKAPDRRTIPLSPRAHDEFHAGRGFCRGWSKQRRRDWQDQEISRLQKLHATWVEFGVIEEPERVAI